MRASEAGMKKAKPQPTLLIREIHSRYSTPTPQRQLLVQQAAQILRERRSIDEARSVALVALRELTSTGRTASPAVKPTTTPRSTLLQQVKDEEDRIVGGTATSRSASRSLSPSQSRRTRSPFPSVASKVAETFRTNATPLPRNTTPPFRVTRSDTQLPLHSFDPLYDKNQTLAHSKLTPFFSCHSSRVRAQEVLPERYTVPDDRNRRKLIASAKQEEIERNNRMKMEHPPLPKWEYWNPKCKRRPSPLHQRPDAAIVGSGSVAAPPHSEVVRGVGGFSANFVAASVSCDRQDPVSQDRR